MENTKTILQVLVSSVNVPHIVTKPKAPSPSGLPAERCRIVLWYWIGPKQVMRQSISGHGHESIYSAKLCSNISCIGLREIRGDASVCAENTLFWNRRDGHVIESINETVEYSVVIVAFYDPSFKAIIFANPPHSW